MAEVKDKLITAESLKAAYDFLLAAISLDTLGITATADEINKVAGITVNSQDLNHLSGVTSNIQEQINALDAEADEIAKSVDAVNNGKVSMDIAEVTLTASGWIDNKQTVSVPGVTEDEKNNAIIPSPALTNRTAYNDAGVYCIQQLADSLVFECDYVPDEDLTVNVVILNKPEVEG